MGLNLAGKHKQHNLLSRGIVSNNISREGFAKNVFFRHGRMEVRQGFGQLAEYDIGVGHNFEDDDIATQRAFLWGYRKHLGSHVMLTDFGHVQIISAFSAKLNTANELHNGMAANLCVISIYDVTTGDRWEEPIHRHTGENNRERVAMPRWKANYQTCIDRDYQDWIQIDGEDEFYFVEYRDVLFFGSVETGMLAYYPAIFNGNLRKQVDKVSERDWQPPYGESSIIVRATPSPGVFEEGVTYFRRSEFPNPTAIAVVSNRLVYASGRTLFFSEPGQPTNIRADNYIQLTDIESEITAIATTQGNIHIFTDREYWTYHPNEGADTVSLGRLNPVSRSVGCSGKNAISYRRNKVVWADNNGIYATTGNYVVETLSLAIDDFFGDRGLADPTTHYYTESGHAYVADDDQPQTFYYFNKDRVHISYWHDKNLLFVSVPAENCTLVLCDNDEWAMWTYETMVSVEAATPRVRAIRNIDEPWLLPYQQELYLVGGPAGKGQAFTDNTARTGGQSHEGSTTSFSYYICQYARGGALDRSTFTEDNREVSGKYDRELSTFGINGRIYLDPWIRLRQGDRLPVDMLITADFNVQVYLIPIVIVPRKGRLPVGATISIKIKIKFDNLIWVPFPINDTEIRYVLPPERLFTNEGYAPGAPVAGTAEVQIYDSASGLPDRLGDEIRINWDQATAGINMNLVENQRNRLMYIPIVAKTGSAVSVDVAGMGMNVTLAQIDGVHTLSPVIWSQFTRSTASSHFVNLLTAQSVDWAYKTVNIDPEDASEIKAHGVDMRIESHGHGDAFADLEQGWLEGMLNIIVDADGAMSQAQRIDFWTDTKSGTQPAVASDHTNLQTVKETYKDTQHSIVVDRPVFRTANVKWGDETDPAKVEYLIGDPLIEDLSTTSNMKGKRVSYLLYGHMRNRAHRLIFQGISGRFDVRPAGPYVRHSTDGGGSI